MGSRSCCLSPVDDSLDQGHSSRPETRQSERSLSRQSGRSSIELDAAPALDYANLDQSGADDDEADPQLSDNEVDQFLQSLKDTGKVCNPTRALKMCNSKIFYCGGYIFRAIMRDMWISHVRAHFAGVSREIRFGFGFA